MISLPNLITPLENLWASFVSVLPGIVAALIIFLIGYIIAKVVTKIIELILYKSKLNEKLAEAGVRDAIGKADVVHLIGLIIRWYIIIIFLQAAVELVKLGAISSLLERVVYWLPNLLIAIVAIIAGLFIAHWVYHAITPKGKNGISLIASVFKWIIVFLAFMVALQQMGIDVSILEKTFLIILAGVMLTLALAVGLGGQEDGKKFLKEFKKYL